MLAGRRKPGRLCHFAVQDVKILLWVEGKGKESDLVHFALAGHLFFDLRWGWDVYR